MDERTLAERYAQRLISLADGKLVEDQANGALSDFSRAGRLRAWKALRSRRTCGSQPACIDQPAELADPPVGISVGVAVLLVAMLSLGIGLQRLAPREGW